MQEIDAYGIKKQRILGPRLGRRGTVNDSSQNKAQVADTRAENIVTGQKKAIEPSHITSRSTVSSKITCQENVAKKNDPTLKASVLLMQSINEQKQQHERNKIKTSIKPVFSSVKTKKAAKKATSAVTKEPTKVDKTSELSRGDNPGTSLRIIFSSIFL